MTRIVPAPIITNPYPVRARPKGAALLRLLRTTDPKQIGLLYLVASLGFFLAGGLMALLMRAELALPGTQVVPNEQYNQLFSTVGAFLLGLSMLPFLWNVFRSYRYGQVCTVDDPWGHGNSLEWATSCPPPRHNFIELPRIRSERPAFELHYPHMVQRKH